MTVQAVHAMLCPRAVPAEAQVLDALEHALAAMLGPVRFERFFGPRLCGGVDTPAAGAPQRPGAWLRVTSPFAASLVRRQYGEALERAARAALGLDEAPAFRGVDQAVDQAACAEGEAAAGLVRLVIDGPAMDGASAATRAPDPSPRVLGRVGAGDEVARGSSERWGPRVLGAASPAAAAGARGRIVDDALDLTRFVVGDANRLALDAARRLVGPSAHRPSQVLYLHGPSGVGKTHLLLGAARAMMAREAAGVGVGSGPGIPRCTGVAALSAEAFANEFIAAVGKHQREPFRRRYRGLGLLAIDDLDALAANVRTQMELVHTVDEVLARGGCVFVTGSRPPTSIERLSEALVSRLCGGMVVGLGRPDAALRRALIGQLAARRGLLLDAAGVEAIERAATAGAAAGPSVRDLEGLVIKVEAVRALLSGVDPDAMAAAGVMPAASVAAALNGRTDAFAAGPAGRIAPGLPGADGRGAGVGAGGEAGEGVRRPVRFEAIVALVSSTLGVDAGELRSASRAPGVVLARAVCVLLARQVTTLSYPEIARALGRPNHSTVVTAFQRVRRQIDAGVAVGGPVATRRGPVAAADADADAGAGGRAGLCGPERPLGEVCVEMRARLLREAARA